MVLEFSGVGPAVWTFPASLEGEFFLGRTGKLTAESAARKVGVGAYFSEFPFFFCPCALTFYMCGTGEK
jgi:hypothetical protein